MDHDHLLKEYADTGSAEAFRELVDGYSGLVLSACRRQTRDHQMAEDAAQSVFVMLAEKAGDLKQGTPLSGWLHKAARFACSHAMREENRRKARERKAAEMAEDRRRDEDLPSWEPVAGLLDEGLGRLRETDRNVILLRYFEGKDFKQVGSALNLRGDAAKMRASRAIKTLRAFFKGRGVAVGLAALGTLIQTNAVQAASPAFAAKCYAAGLAPKAIASGALAASVPAKVLGYAQGGIKMMFWARVKVVTTTVLLAVAGSGLVATAAAEALRLGKDEPVTAGPFSPKAPAARKARAGAPGEIVFSLKQDSRVSVAVYDEDGVQVRTLLNAEPKSKGKHTVHWDGLDRDGQPVAPGKYTWKILSSQGLTAEYLMNIGTSTQDHWPGNHSGPQAALVIGDVLYMTAGNSESPLTTVKLDLTTGKRLGSWQKLSNWSAITDLAYDNAPIAIPESSFPEGQLYLPVPVDGRVHIVDPRVGGTAVNDYYRKKHSNPVFFAPLMRLDFTDDTSPAQAGWTQAKPELYTKPRGFGWESLDGISGFTARGLGDTNGHRVPRTDLNERKIHTFLVDVPIGDWQQYHVVFHLGHPEQAIPQFNIYGGLNYDKPAWISTVGTEAGNAKTVSYSIKPMPGTQLRLGFGPASKDSAGCAIRGIEIMTGPDRVDAHEGKVAIGYSISNVVQEISANAHEMLASYPVPDLRDVALLSDGTILALSGDTVVKVTQRGLTPVIRSLVDPRRLSVDRTTGELFVVEGEDSWQIKRFSAAYSLRGTYGRKGGREQGLYVAKDFMEVSSLAPDGKGGFVITEANGAPRRTAHFDKNGNLLREWYGGQLWATNAAIDPKDDTRIWLNSQWNWLIEAEVDWGKRTWQPRATYLYGGLAKGLTPAADGNIGFLRVLYRNGTKYLAANCNSPVLLRVDEKNHRLVPVMSANLNITHYWTAQPPFIQGLMGNAQSPHRSHVWNDLSGDREPQADEVAFSSWSMWGPRWVCDDAGVFHGAGTAPPNYQHVSLPPDASGRYPSFDRRVAKSLPPPPELRRADGGLPEPRGVWLDASQNTYAVFEGKGDDGYGGNGESPGHAAFWPANNTTDTAFCKWDAQGRLLWSVGRKACRMDGELRGTLYAPVKVHPEVNGYVAIGDRVVHPVEIWTTDGLYVGGLFDHRKDDGLPATYYSWWRDDRAANSSEHESLIEYDMVTGGMFFQRKNGDMMYCADGYNNLPTYRITGWDQIARQEGEVSVPAGASRASVKGSGLAAEYFGNATLSGGPILKQTDAQLYFDQPHQKPWPAKGAASNPFSARWTGELEPRFSEEYTISIYAQAANVRVWVDGQSLIDSKAAGEGTRDAIANYRAWREYSRPVKLTAGKKVKIRVEWKGTGGNAELHLNWQSVTQAIEHIPARCLYP